MAGEAFGKLKLVNTTVFLVSKNSKIKLKKPTVYIHLKGYAFARVTHLDIEHEIMDNIIPPKRGYFLNIHGIKGGIEIKVEKEIEYEKKKFEVKRIEILHPLLNRILKEGEKTRTWVGGKFGGIYIGFKKKEVEKLEKIAEEEFRMKPR